MSADAQWDIVIRGLRRRSQTDEQIAYCEEIVAALRERQQRLEDALREIAYGMTVNQFGAGYDKANDATKRIARAALGEPKPVCCGGGYPGGTSELVVCDDCPDDTRNEDPDAGDL